MTWSGDELLAAHREEEGPDAAATARLLARRDAMGPPAQPLVRLQARHDADRTAAWWSPTQSWTTRAAVAVTALAAATILGWWIRGEVATPVESSASSLASDRANVETAGGEFSDRDPVRTTGKRRAGSPPAPSSPAPSVADEPATTATVVRVPVPPVEPTTPLAPAAKRPPRVKKPSARPIDPPAVVPRKDSLAAETRTIGRARAALSRGKPRVAVGLLGGYQRAFPAGTLREEADAIRTMANCRLDPGAAKGRRDSFLNRHPKSLFAVQVRAGCAAEKE